MKLHLQISDEQEVELLAEALDGVAEITRAIVEKNATMRRELIRGAILRRLPQ